MDHAAHSRPQAGRQTFRPAAGECARRDVEDAGPGVMASIKAATMNKARWVGSGMIAGTMAQKRK